MLRCLNRSPDPDLNQFNMSLARAWHFHLSHVSTQSTQKLESQELLFKKLKGSFSPLLFAFPRQSEHPRRWKEIRLKKTEHSKKCSSAAPKFLCFSERTETYFYWNLFNSALIILLAWVLARKMLCHLLRFCFGFLEVRSCNCIIPKRDIHSERVKFWSVSQVLSH